MKKDRNTGFENFSDWLKNNNQPLISSKGLSKVIKQSQLKIETENPLPETHNDSHDQNLNTSKPQIDLEEKDGIVIGLKITCICGELIHVKFNYDPDSGETVIQD